MGYTEGWNSKEELVAHLTKDWKKGEKDGQPLMCRLIGKSLRGNKLWTAWEDETQLVNGKPIQFIILFSMGSNRHNNFYWGYKAESEDMGPCDTNCPVYLLSVASNTDDSKFAKEWRDDVLAAKSKAKNDKAMLTKGTIIEFPYELSFQSYGTHSQFKVYDPKKRYFELPNGEIIRLRQATIDGGNFKTIPDFS